MNKKKVIVFGGAGFIGTHLIGELIKENVYDIYCVDLRLPDIQYDNVVYIQKNVCDLSSLDKYENVETIYNFAAIHTTPGHEPYEYYETNVLGALEICNYARSNSINEIVFTSSISVYGPSEEEKNEFSIPKPESDYGYSKLIAEKINKEWQSENIKNKLVVIRPAVVFGKGEGGNFTRLASLLKKGFFLYPGRKDTIKSCIYVKDLLALIFSSRNINKSYTLVNGTYNDKYTVSSIVEDYFSAHFKNINTFVIPNIILIIVAHLLKMTNFLNVGIHPERVAKLVNSTNIRSKWTEKEKITFPYGLSKGLEDWCNESKGEFK